MTNGILRAALAAAVMFGLALGAGDVMAAVKTKTIEYKDGDTTLKGMLA